MIEPELTKALRTVAADVMSQMEPTLAKMRRDLAEVEHRIEEMERPAFVPDATTLLASMRAERVAKAESAAAFAQMEADRLFLSRIAERYARDHAFGPMLTNDVEE